MACFLDNSTLPALHTWILVPYSRQGQEAENITQEGTGGESPGSAASSILGNRFPTSSLYSTVLQIAVWELESEIVAEDHCGAGGIIHVSLAREQRHVGFFLLHKFNQGG